MRLTPVALAIPLFAFLKLTGCSSNDAPNGAPTDDAGMMGTDGDMTTDGDVPPQDGGADAAAPLLPSQCKVSTKGTAGVVFRGALLMPESIIPAGELFATKDGIIACAAADCSATTGYAAASIVTCADVTISPGLINPHDHITFADVTPKPNAERYEQRHDWRKGIRNHTKISTTPVSGVPNSTLAAELRFVMSGATSGVTSGGEKGMIRNLDNATLLEGANVQAALFDTFPLGDQGSTTTAPQIAVGCAYPSKTTSASVATKDGYFPHIAEGVDNEAHNEMTCQSSTVAGPDLAFDLIQHQTAVIHGIAVTATEAAEFRTAQTALVWSPRSNVSLYGATASVGMYDRLGVSIALGTDWLPSGSMNILRELQCADGLNKTTLDNHFTDKALWKMVTINAAIASGAPNALGMLKPGYLADITLFNSKTNKGYRAVIDASPEDVLLVVRGGTSLYGDSDLLDGLDGKDCEPIAVCGTAKKACVKKDTGVTLAAVQTDAAKVYPLFFCKGATITNEPSCTPTRADFKSGSTGSVYAGATATDKDGDGLLDGADNCPAVFNPIRPMDNGVQADTDGDAIGDACDKCPLTAGETCTPPDANDIDGDTILDGNDNCPELANTDQADGDSDGHGDLCDKCPAQANLGMGFCTLPFTVLELRDPSQPTHPAAGTVRAHVTGVEVIAVKTVGAGDLGFWVQDPDPARLTFGGLFVWTTAAPTVLVGNVVDVTGDYQERFSLTTLANPAITVTGAGTTSTIVPQAIPVATLASLTLGEPYEGMMVVVGPTAVLTMNPDAPKDFDEFAVTGNLRVDDEIYDAMDNTYPVATTFTSITAVASFSFAKRKIWPRTAADIITP